VSRDRAVTQLALRGYGDVYFVQIWAGAESTLPGGSAAQFASDVWNNGDITPIVPEPTSMALLGLGGLMMVLRRRRMRRRRSA